MAGVLLNLVSPSVTIPANDGGADTGQKWPLALYATDTPAGGGETTRLKMLSWGISFNGVANAEEPLLVRLQRVTRSVGGTAETPNRMNSTIDDALRASGEYNFAALADLSAVANGEYESRYVHPQTSLTHQFSFLTPRELAPGEVAAIYVNNPTDAVTYEVITWILFEQ